MLKVVLRVATHALSSSSPTNLKAACKLVHDHGELATAIWPRAFPESEHFSKQTYGSREVHRVHIVATVTLVTATVTMEERALKSGPITWDLY